MRTIICKRCGAQFDAKTYDITVCPACRDAATHQKRIRERTCRSCGAVFLGGPHAWYCMECRDERQRERAAKYRKNGFNRRLGDIDNCVRCGAEYVITSGLQKYCPSCSKPGIFESMQPRKNEYQREYNRKRRAEEGSREKVCVVCGKHFSAASPTVTCSPECAKIRKRTRTNEMLIRQGRRKLAADEVYDSGLPKSGIPGVTYIRKTGHWQASYKGHYIGVYADVDTAAQAINDYKKDKE